MRERQKPPDGVGKWSEQGQRIKNFLNATVLKLEIHDCHDYWYASVIIKTKWTSIQALLCFQEIVWYMGRLTPCEILNTFPSISTDIPNFFPPAPTVKSLYKCDYGNENKLSLCWNDTGITSISLKMNK